MSKKIIKTNTIEQAQKFFSNDFLACLLILLLTLVFWHEIAFMGNIPLLRDLNGELIPWRIYAKQSILQGEIPLWNPYSYSGQPFLANPLTAVFYPFSALFYFLPLKPALNLYILLHFFIAGISMYSLMRCWRVSPGGALISAITFAFSGWMVTSVEFFSFAASAWTPLIVMLIFKLIKKPGLYLSLITGSVIAVQTTTTNPQNQFYTVIATGLMVVIFTFLLAFTDKKNTLTKVLGFILLTGGLSIALSAIQLLPTIEFASLTARGHISVYHGMPDKFSLHPVQLVMLLVPNFFGYANWQKCFYVGIMPLLLSSFLFSFRKKKKRMLLFDLNDPFSQRNIKIYLLMLLLLGLFLSMGHYTFLAGIFVAIVPFLEQILKWSSLSMYLTCFTLAGLAGFGYESIARTIDQTISSRLLWKRCLNFLFLLLVVNAILILIFCADIVFNANILQGLKEGYYQNLLQFQNQTVLPESYSIHDEYLKMLIFLNVGIILIGIWSLKLVRPMIITALLIIFIFADLFVFGSKKNFTSKENLYLEQPINVSRIVAQDDFSQFRVASWLRPLSDLMYGNRDLNQFRAIRNMLAIETSLPWHIFKLFGWRSMLTERIDILESQIQNPNVPKKFSQNLLSLFNVKYMLAVDPLKKASELHTVPNVYFVENKNYLQRAVVVYDYQVLSGEQEILAKMASLDFDPAKKVVLEENPGIVLDKKKEGPIGDWSVESIKYSANNVTLEARTDRKGILFMSDTYYPGWRAYINGRETKIYRANYAFRAIIIPSGKHNIKFAYKPISFLIGKWVSGVSLGFCIVLGFFSYFTARKKAKRKIASG